MLAHLWFGITSRAFSSRTNDSRQMGSWSFAPTSTHLAGRGAPIQKLGNPTRRTSSHDSFAAPERVPNGGLLPSLKLILATTTDSGRDDLHPNAREPRPLPRTPDIQPRALAPRRCGEIAQVRCDVRQRLASVSWYEVSQSDPSPSSLLRGSGRVGRMLR